MSLKNYEENGYGYDLELAISHKMHVSHPMRIGWRAKNVHFKSHQLLKA